MLRLYGDDPSPDMFPEYFERVSGLIDSVWPRCLELGLDVVLDLNFWNREQRDRVREEALGLGAEVRLYRLACSDEEAWARIERRNADLTLGLLITRDTFEVLKSQFEPLGDDEACIEATTCDPASSMP
jgi:predicted kinase